MAFGDATVVSDNPDSERGPRILFRWDADGRRGDMQIVPPTTLSEALLRGIARISGIVIEREPFISVPPTTESDGGAIHGFTSEPGVLSDETSSEIRQKMALDAARTVLNNMNGATALTALGEISQHHTASVAKQTRSTAP